eukprot:5972052-Pyramimonas_sp.AAC.1
MAIVVTDVQLETNSTDPEVICAELFPRAAETLRVHISRVSILWMTVNGESAPVESLGNPHTPPAGSAARRLLQTGNNGVVVDLDFEMAVRPPASSEDRT